MDRISKPEKPFSQKSQKYRLEYMKAVCELYGAQRIDRNAENKPKVELSGVNECVGSGL